MKKIFWIFIACVVRLDLSWLLFVISKFLPFRIMSYRDFIAGFDKIPNRDKIRKNGPKIALLCSAWNTQETFLREMLDSVVLQTYEDWILCINNCSDSNHEQVGDILSEYSERDSRIKVTRTENRSIAQNTNKIFKMAELYEAEFILLLDHDDILLPWTLSTLMDVQIQHDADFVYGDEYKYYMKQGCVQEIHKHPFSISALERTNYINHPALIRCSLFRSIGGFRDGYDGSQDYDLYLRLLENKAFVAYSPACLYCWRINATSFSQRSMRRCIDSGYHALEDHFRRIGVSVLIKPHSDFPSYDVLKKNDKCRKK